MKKFKHIFATVALVAGAVHAQGVDWNQALTSTHLVQNKAKYAIVEYNLIPVISCSQQAPSFASYLAREGVPNARNIGAGLVVYYDVKKNNKAGKVLKQTNACYFVNEDNDGVVVFVERPLNYKQPQVAEIPADQLQYLTQ